MSGASANRLEVTLLMDDLQDDIHASSVYTGLTQLANEGLIRLGFSRGESSAERKMVSDPLTVCLRVTSDRLHVKTIAIDLHDQNDVFGEAPLTHCTEYFKRSFHSQSLELLPSDLASKVRPLGLNFACRTAASSLWFMKALRSVLLRSPRMYLERLRNHLSLPTVGEYEQQPAAVVKPAIVFQTRVWEEHEAPGEADEVNERRVALIRALRAEFRDTFVGGLVRTKLAVERYAGDLTNWSTRRRSYIMMSKRHLIGIYSEGLWRSTAFKLSEYLAASQCIVGERPFIELPAPLVRGRNYLGFQTVDQCIEACHQLLHDHALVSAMRRENYAYYMAHVAPAARMAHVLGIPRRSPSSDGLPGAALPVT